MSVVGYLRSKMLVMIGLFVFALGLAILALGFVFLTACGCEPIPESPPPAGQISRTAR